MENLINKKVIVRAEGSGVFFGTLTAKNDSEVQLTNARKLYYWSGANTVEDLAVAGAKNPQNCKFTVAVDEVTINKYLQIIPCTKASISNIENTFVWKA